MGNAAEVGILSHAVLPTEVRTKSKTCEQWYLRIGYQLMAQIFKRILRHDIRLLLLLLVNKTIRNSKIRSLNSEFC